MPLTLEIVRFRSKEGAEEQVLAARPALLAVLQRFQGVRGAYLSRLDDGTWVDVVVWASREDAETAAREIMEVPEVAAFMGSIDEVLSMEHSEVSHLLSPEGEVTASAS